jgi:hypothetical protein
MFGMFRIIAVLVTAAWCASPALADESVPACALMSTAEIKKIAGPAVQDWEYQLPRNGSALGGGGSECELPGFTLQLDAAPISRYKERMKIWGAQTKFEPVGGIGDEAHFYVQDDDTVGVYARVGKHMFVVSKSVPTDKTPQSVRPLVEAMAKAVAAKLK